MRPMVGPRTQAHEERSGKNQITLEEGNGTEADGSTPAGACVHSSAVKPTPSQGEFHMVYHQGENMIEKIRGNTDTENGQSMGVTRKNDSIVAVLDTHLEAEQIVKELQMAGL
jgi:hypothetical protein